MPRETAAVRAPGGAADCLAVTDPATSGETTIEPRPKVLPPEAGGAGGALSRGSHVEAAGPYQPG